MRVALMLLELGADPNAMKAPRDGSDSDEGDSDSEDEHVGVLKMIKKQSIMEQS